ncbi:MAG: DNA alkylation repair protein [Acidobacteriota bacterium]
MTTTTQPRELARRVTVLLRARGSPETAAQSRKFFKEEDVVSFHGLKTAQLREIERSFWEEVKGQWTLADAIELCEIMLPTKYLEEKGFATSLFLRFKKDFSPGSMETIREWLSKDYLNNWASVDALCPAAFEELLGRYPKLAGKIKTWTAHPNRWVKRASIVAFINLARHGRFLDAAYDVAERLFATDDDLIQKAMGWLLREAGKTDMERLERFLLTEGPRLPRTTLRYAIERFPDAKRRHLLAATRA